MTTCGSYRRGAATCGDVDILFAPSEAGIYLSVYGVYLFVCLLVGWLVGLVVCLVMTALLVVARAGGLDIFV